MVVEIVENPSNQNMHYAFQRPVTGTLAPPNKLPKKILYSDRKATMMYNQLQSDIYNDQKSYNRRHTKGKFPTVLKYIFGALALATAVIFRKDLVKCLKKINPFK